MSGTPDRRRRLILDAVAALTALAHGERTVGAGTPGEHVEPDDFAEIVTHVLASVAANVGGVEELLAGRPGSWEADGVRDLLGQQVGDRFDLLLSFRTEPVRVGFTAADAFCRFGLDHLYEAAVEELGERAAGASGLDDAARAEAELEAVDRLYRQDLAVYWGAFQRAVREKAGRAVWGAFEVHFVHPADGRWEDDDPVADQLVEHALRITPLPMTGEPPDWGEGSPAASLRRAGVTYTARAEAAAA